MYALPYRSSFGHFLCFCCYTPCCNKHPNPNALHTCFAGNTIESLAGGPTRKPCEDCCADGATCLQTSGMTPSPLSPAFQTSPSLRDSTFRKAFSSLLLLIHPTGVTEHLLCAHSRKSTGTWVSSILFLTSWVSRKIIHLAYISWGCAIQSLPGPFVEDKQTTLIP